MPGLWFYTDPIDRLHQENLQFLQRQRFIKARQPNSQHNRAVEKRSIEKVTEIATSLGYRINPTVKNSPFDLWIEGARVEVKGSTWHEWTKGGRYQANIRNHNCDLLIFDCINGTDHLHFIPAQAIGGRRNITVWSYAPENSSGIWRPYLEEIQYLHQAIEAASQSWQPPLF